MKLKLADLDPQLLKRTSPVDYDVTDDVASADALMLQCPACHWVQKRLGMGETHAMVLWGDAPRWRFVGRNYDDLSLMAGRTVVVMTAGACRARFHIKNGRVDFDAEQQSEFLC